MVKRIVCALLCLVFAFLLVGCSGNNPLNNVLNDHIFEVVEQGQTYQILVYKDTGVMYMYAHNGRFGGLSVMLNPDGTPMVWDGDF